MHRKIFNILSLVLVLAVAFSAVAPVAAQPSLKTKGGGQGGPVEESSNGVYIIQMADNPVVAYTGDIKGLKATKPKPGQKINPNSPNVVNYVAYLDGKHNEALGKVGGQKLYDYRYSFNGFAAKLTLEQANKLAFMNGVLAVTADEMYTLDTSDTPTFLGLDAANGVWSTLSGNSDGNPIVNNGPNSAGAGEGVVVGILDSGIWPENPSFSDRDANGQRVFQQLPGWHGKCVPGEEFAGSDCNQKLISAQWYNSGWGGDSEIKGLFPYEFVSARAADGHGVHTASTAAGNYGVDAVIGGKSYGLMSGMAPRARVAVYKVCWGIAPEGGCFGSDSVAAIDQSVADGVDVLNFSISGTRTNFRDPVEIAWLFAADAGVFVAASAGNEGPGASTVAHPSPWITTVAASTHDRFGNGSVTLGNGETYFGASLTDAVGPAPIVNSDDVGLAGADATEVLLCYPGTLDPALVTGKIVVCDRGVIGRTEKSLAVQQAGGVGMVLINPTANTLHADAHFVPTVHLQNTDRAAVRAYADTPGATATISAGVVTQVQAPLMASFSSRGPLLAGNGDLLKPDITAPGVDVLAAYSPVATGRDFEFLSGTSMSSPHMAGIGALMKDLYPTWSPAAIKSALMTTAYQTTKTVTPGVVFGNVFSYGAGHVDPNKAMNPGIVFDAGFNDYLGFLCGTQLPTSFCTGAGVPVLDPSNLNVPSIAIGDLAGSQVVTRKVTNVSGQTATFTAVTNGLSGVTVAVSPSAFTLAPGQSQSLTVTFTNVSATLNAYTQGAITWTSNLGHTARIPTVVRPVALAAPTQVNGTGDPISYNVTFGYSGAFTATARGLVPAVTFADTVVDDPSDDINTALDTGVGITIHAVTVPAGSSYARFSLFDDFTDGNDDLDLYIFTGAGAFVGSSGSGTSAEEVNVVNPTSTTYLAVVHGWQTDGPDANYTLFTWALGTTSAGNMTVSAPASATLGATGSIGLTFSGLASGTKYLGSVAYGGASGMPNPTIVRVDTP